MCMNAQQLHYTDISQKLCKLPEQMVSKLFLSGGVCSLVINYQTITKISEILFS
jgi:hypothetical protein